MKRSIPGILAALVVVSCGGPAEPERSAPREPERILAEAEEIGIPNPRAPFADRLIGGQPTEEQFDALVQAGYRTFINLRPIDEPGTGWEATRASRLGVRYESIPVAGAADVTEDSARALWMATADAEGPAFLYCRSGNRVGALLALAAYRIDGESAERALEIGLSAGLTKLEARVRELLGLPPVDSP